MEGVFRRGGIWYARLVVPVRLRGSFGKTEFVASTGLRNPATARIVAGERLASWRREIYEIDRIANPSMTIDFERLAAPHPTLSRGGHLPIADAAAITGLDVETLLRESADGRIGLFYRASGVAGYQLPLEELLATYGQPDGSVEVPPPRSMPVKASERNFSGLLALRPETLAAAAGAMLAGSTFEAVLFVIADDPQQAFAPDTAIHLGLTNVELEVRNLAEIRALWAARTTAEERETFAKTKSATVPREPHAGKRVSDAVDAYMRVRRKTCNSEQGRRIANALELFTELDGNPKLTEIDAARLERYRDRMLPTVPAKENQVRLKHGSKTITESIAVADSLGLPRISPAEQVKRLKWLSAMFSWLDKKEWIARDPSVTLVAESDAAETTRKGKGRARDSRGLFTQAELTDIFSVGPWFQSGRGTLTKAGTYREFSPSYYWLPLLGLFTGARITELSQLSLSDIKQTAAGTWYVDLATLDDAAGEKRRKNANSERSVPLHPMLVSLGLIQWRDKLRASGYDRLFPELKHDAIKGFGKQSSKWFSSYLSRMGWERDGRKVFHSFRSTLASHCINRLKLSELQTSQITGHARPSGVLFEHYAKDETVDELRKVVDRLDFDLPAIAPFDVVEGMAAVTNALARKT